MGASADRAGFFPLADGHVVERADLSLDRDYGDFFFLHPSRELPPGEFRDLMAGPAKVAA